jgi:hypothetical protein
MTIPIRMMMIGVRVMSAALGLMRVAAPGRGLAVPANHAVLVITTVVINTMVITTVAMESVAGMPPARTRLADITPVIERVLIGSQAG